MIDTMSAPVATPTIPSQDAVSPSANRSPDAAPELPSYTRNLLRIKVPVTVTLAKKKQPISSIIELVPGAIVQFNKSCEEMLELEVAGHAAACGECIKVGDKFGLRITSMILPDERFKAVRP